MKLKLLILWCSLLALPLTAQQNPKSYRWEVGLDVLSLFNKNSLPSYSIFGRYLINPSGGKPAFLRSRLGYQTTNNITNTTKEFYNYQESRKQNLLATIGIQKDIYTTAKSSFYYGADVVFNRFRDRQLVISGDEVGDGFAGFKALNTETNLSTSLFGFVGFSRKLFSNLSLSFESSLFLRKSSTDFNYKGIFSDGSVHYNGENSSETFTAGTTPFYQVIITLNLYNHD